MKKMIILALLSSTLFLTANCMFSGLKTMEQVNQEKQEKIASILEE